MRPPRVVRWTSPVTAGLMALLHGPILWGPTAAAAGEGNEPAEITRRPVIEVVAAPARRGEHLRVEALVTTERVRRVDFLIDGELVETDRHFPFGAIIPTGSLEAEVLYGRLEGVAFDRQGREIARDRLDLDRSAGDVSLSLSPVSRLGEGDWLEVAAVVRHASDVSIDRVDFYRDDRYVATVRSAPYRVRIRSEAESGFVRAVALTRGGGFVERVRLLDDRTHAEEVSVGLVELYAMVTNRGGAPVTGLEAGAFDLRRDGEPLAIERFSEGDSVPLSLALVIDGSGSMLDDMERAKRSAGDFLTATLDAGDRALLVDFDSRPRLLQDATEDVAALVGRFGDIRTGGGSSIYDAILFAALQLEGAVGRRALVVVTDGLDSGSRISSRDCAAEARRLGMPIFVLGMEEAYSSTPSHRRLELRELSLGSGGGYYAVRGSGDVSTAYEAIETQLRGQYLLGFSTEAPLSSDELAGLTLDVADERLTVRTILGGQVHGPD